MAVISGTLFALAYFTKQLALPLILIFAPISILISRGRAWLIWLTASTLGAAVFLILDNSSQGWFSFYTFKALTGHTLVSGWFTFWKLLLPEMWPTFLIVLLFLLASRDKTLPRQEKWRGLPWPSLGFSLALILTSWSIFFKIWTYNNDLMPACAGIAILTGISTRQIFSKSSPNLPQPQQVRASVETAVIGLLFLQFVCLFYNPLVLIPDGKTYQKTQKFVSRLESLPGEVFSFQHGFVNYLAGKTSYLHATPLADVNIGAFSIDSDVYQRQNQARRAFDLAVEGQLFDWVILDKFQPYWLPYYIQTGSFMREVGAYYPGRNSQIIPQVLLTKNPLVQGGELALDETRLDGIFSLGWSTPRPGERWANGPQSILSIALENQAAYGLQLTARPVCLHGEPGIDEMQVLWNSRVLGQLSFNSCNPVTGEYLIPEGRLHYQDYNKLSFEFHRSIVTTAIFHERNSEWPAACFSNIIFTRK